MKGQSGLTHPVYDSSRVKVLDAAEHLVQQVGHSFVVKLHLDHLAEIGVHELHHNVTLEGRQNRQRNHRRTFHPILSCVLLRLTQAS